MMDMAFRGSPVLQQCLFGFDTLITFSSSFRSMKNVRAALVVSLFFSLLTLIGCRSFAQTAIRPLTIQPDWVRDLPAFRLAGNLYYVGSYDLACYLIATPEGNILINTGVAGSDTMIRKHVEDLGFKWSDIKILLTSQAHFDHVG